jgi:hypothetical protein
MEVDIQIQGVAEALHEGYRATAGRPSGIAKKSSGPPA